jgi:hypothetical protein
MADFYIIDFPRGQRLQFSGAGAQRGVFVIFVE